MIMHKLKNKHTGEAITTPYLAEVEEYLNSGDYEMSDNKYPYIGQIYSAIVLYYRKNDGVLLGDALGLDGNEIGKKINGENGSKNITREYLTNTYGKCESQEHADFICKLAESAEFTFYNDYKGIHDHFWFDGKHMEFDDAKEPLKAKAKLIHLPLPPKEKEMEETKPVYTKEMHERGELPAIGAKVKYPSGEGVIVANKPDESGVIIVLDSHYNEYKRVSLAGIEPIPTIEDELADYISKTRGHSSSEMARRILEKYNITPKGE